MSCTKQLQYFERALVSLSGNQFHQIVKGISGKNWKTVSEGIDSGLQIFSMSKNYLI